MVLNSSIVCTFEFKKKYLKCLTFHSNLMIILLMYKALVMCIDWCHCLYSVLTWCGHCLFNNKILYLLFLLLLTEIQSWIICDGDIDPEWIESLNSVLDDNRLLTMPSGERIQFGPNVNFLFETHDLSCASPATISRMGMIFMRLETIYIKDLLEWKERKSSHMIINRFQLCKKTIILNALIQRFSERFAKSRVTYSLSKRHSWELQFVKLLCCSVEV